MTIESRVLFFSVKTCLCGYELLHISTSSLAPLITGCESYTGVLVTSYRLVNTNRPTRFTNSYNVSLFIIKCSTCFGLFSLSSGRRFRAVHRIWYIPVYADTSGCCVASCVAIATQQPHVWYQLIPIAIYSSNTSLLMMD